MDSEKRISFWTNFKNAINSIKRYEWMLFIIIVLTDLIPKTVSWIKFINERYFLELL